MDLSLEEAVSLINKLITSGVPVAAVFTSPSRHVRCKVTGRLFLIEDEGVHSLIVKSSGLDCSVSFDLLDCKYVYGDSREAPEQLRESAERRYESVLSVINSLSREVFHIMEVRL